MAITPGEADRLQREHDQMVRWLVYQDMAITLFNVLTRYALPVLMLLLLSTALGNTYDPSKIELTPLRTFALRMLDLPLQALEACDHLVRDTIAVQGIGSGVSPLCRERGLDDALTHLVLLADEVSLKWAPSYTPAALGAWRHVASVRTRLARLYDFNVTETRELCGGETYRVIFPVGTMAAMVIVFM